MKDYQDIFGEVKQQKKRMRILYLLILFFFAFLTIFTIKKRLFKEVEFILEDTMYQNLAATPYQFKVIAIDEETLEDLGPYTQWNRGVFSSLQKTLNQSEEVRPLLVAYDIVFTSTNDSPEDKDFAEEAGKYDNVIVGSLLSWDTSLKEDEGNYHIENHIIGESLAYDALDKNTDHGFTNAITDEDGYLRRSYGMLTEGDQTYKGFSYVIAERIAALSEEELEKADLLKYKGKEFSSFDNIFNIEFTGKTGEFETLPMSKVLSGEIPASYFDDCIVFVGAHEESMRDAYFVPVNHSELMYGVEIHANTVWALLNDKQSKNVPELLQILVSLICVIVFLLWFQKKGIKKTLPLLVIFILGYPLLAFFLYKFVFLRLYILYIPLLTAFAFLVQLLLKYVEMQKQRSLELQRTLFSMADAMSEAIDGRTPYNASHTRNVALRSLEMTRYMNQMYKEGNGKYFFTLADQKQIYLASMLHDVGKMDVPLEVMDKPDKLGTRKANIENRFEIIKLHYLKDAYEGKITMEKAKEEIAPMDEFLSKLGLFNCGKPLNEGELGFIEEMYQRKYILEDGTELSYLTKEEYDCLHIKAGTFTDEEYAIMRSHVEFTDRILAPIYFGDAFKDVHRIASSHHELLNGKGYHKGLKGEEIDILTRIVTVMDIYDALIADDRPYKKAKPNFLAFKILEEEVEFGKLDGEIVAIAKEMYYTEEDEKARLEDERKMAERRAAMAKKE